MAKKKKTTSRTVESDESMSNAPHGDQMSTSHDQPVEPDVHEGEEIVVDDIPPTTLDTSVDEATPAAREKSELEPHKPIKSYAETLRSSDPSEFANDHFQPLRL
jgi:hypothetical protein